MEDNKIEKELIAFSPQEVGYAMKETCKRVKEKLKEMDENPEELRKLLIDWMAYQSNR